MAKLKRRLDLNGVFERMMRVKNMTTLNQLAESMGVSYQSIIQAKHRAMISLPTLMVCAEETGCSLDYLVYNHGDGTERPNKVDASEMEKSHIDVPRIGGGKVKFYVELLQRGIDVSKLIAYVQFDKLWIIDTSNAKITSGLFAIGDPDCPEILQCKKMLNGTDTLIEGSDTPVPESELGNISCIGKVVWFGQRYV